MAKREPSLSAHLRSFPPYSYRTDPAMPAFPDDKALIVFDGVCVLCEGFAQLVVRNDTGRRFLLTMAQSHLGQALYRHYRLDPSTLESNLLIESGTVRARMDASTTILAGLGWPWRAASALRVFPEPVQDWIYDRVALNRYTLFGRHDTCIVPPPDWRERYIA